MLFPLTYRVQPPMFMRLRKQVVRLEGFLDQFGVVHKIENEHVMLCGLGAIQSGYSARRSTGRIADEHPRENPRAARHLSGFAFRHRAEPAMVARSVPRRSDDAARYPL